MNYKLFYGRDYYPSGGYQDFGGTYESVEDAKKHLENKCLQNELYQDDMWAQIVVENNIIIEGTLEYPGKCHWEWSETE